MDGASIVLSATDLTARVHSFGASLSDLRLRGHPHPLVHVYDDAALIRQPHFACVVIGRFANRIAGGRTTVAGRELTLERNDAGVHALHGGSHGLASRCWQVENAGKATVTFRLDSRDGEQVFPALSPYGPPTGSSHCRRWPSR